jgi:hypothetical protein
MAKQGYKISFLKILNYTSPPPLINYDQSLIAIINKYEDISQSLILMDVSELLVKRAAVSSIYCIAAYF